MFTCTLILTEDAPVVRAENATAFFPETRVAPDGIAYSWAEFDNYSDTDMATEIWKAAHVAVPPEPAQT